VIFTDISVSDDVRLETTYLWLNRIFAEAG